MLKCRYLDTRGNSVEIHEEESRLRVAVIDNHSITLTEVIIEGNGDAKTCVMDGSRHSFWDNRLKERPLQIGDNRHHADLQTYHGYL